MMWRRKMLIEIWMMIEVVIMMMMTNNDKEM